RVVGVDFSPRMLARARDRTAGLAVELVERDVFDWQPDEAFDLVTCFGAFGHIPRRDEPAFVELVHRALRPGGAFVFASAEEPPWWSRAHLLARAFNAGMHLRNALIRPPFIMFYLTFTLPACQALLEARGFAVTRRRAGLPAPFHRLEVVTARRSPA